MSIRQHHRYQECERQKGDVKIAWLNALHETDLTLTETLSLLNELMSSTIKYMMRHERHPNEPHKPADME